LSSVSVDPITPLQKESAMPTSNRTHTLLTPENCTVIFIDHQPQMTFGLRRSIGSSSSTT
jgi:hypothetical protein